MTKCNQLIPLPFRGLIMLALSNFGSAPTFANTTPILIFLLAAFWSWEVSAIMLTEMIVLQVSSAVSATCFTVCCCLYVHYTHDYCRRCCTVRPKYVVTEMQKWKCGTYTYGNVLSAKMESGKTFKRMENAPHLQFFPQFPVLYAGPHLALVL